MSMTHNVTDTNVMGEINVTPMVDVMLVLLIIFMVVTPAIVAGFNAQLPYGAHLKARPEKDDRSVLGIDAEGRYYLNKKPIKRENALDLLTREFAKHPDDKVLFVKADKGLRYKEVLDAMDLAKKAGAKVVAAVTEQKPGTVPDEEVKE
jgi:biopolymer transport protein ExbD